MSDQQKIKPAPVEKPGDEKFTRILAKDQVAQLITSEFYRDLTAQGIDDIERDDPVFFSCIIQTLLQANNTKFQRPATKQSLGREEQHGLIRIFSAEHLGLSGFELGAALRDHTWRERYLSWLEKQNLRVRGMPGAPKKAQADETRARYEAMGKPPLTAEVCDELAQSTYPDEFTNATKYSKLRKILRDRVRRQVRPLLIAKPDSNPAI